MAKLRDIFEKPVDRAIEGDFFGGSTGGNPLVPVFGELVFLFLGECVDGGHAMVGMLWDER